MERLREQINDHNYRYYVLDAPEITDAEYDRADAPARGARARASRTADARFSHPARRRRAQREVRASWSIAA